jgi:hypothetical protein
MAYGFWEFWGAVAERLGFSHLGMSCFPSVAQTNIFAVGCVADATGVYGWEVGYFLCNCGRMKLFYEKRGKRY